ncbi:formate dehydrogenase accessory sulfurtransferase FdhD [Thiocapsa rosea]|uniref:Sulfur carrier protein FdhD n=1 Tax=Thiocapsa rosea TaxID=69360 RepID=A0A495VCS4_9GAMM|nr:formate dehydrogenase accessory sulfurtransferase FdhD [Thiocapsa rosea]RKT47139.1 formate dehydrogenase accessory protein FdhD [Thiocapsa rosea]
MECPLPFASTEDAPDERAPIIEWPDQYALEVVALDRVRSTRRRDRVIEEVPIALVFNCISHAVMLATPTDLEDFALGFSLGEGILRSPGELLDCEPVGVPEGIEIRMTVVGWRFAELKERRRTLAGRTGCGLCGVESLKALSRPVVPVSRTCVPRAGAVARAVAVLPVYQRLFRETGGGHAAAWIDADGDVQLVREDVGRHNALDKLIGALTRRGFTPHAGFIICTSRASYEMVQKAMSAGVGLLVAVSAPTGAAVRLAEAAGMTLVGFARGERMSVYTHPRSILLSVQGFSMDIHNLVKMANQIGDFFGAWPDQQEACDEIASHLKRFWDPRMRARMIAHVEETDGAGLSEIVTQAIRQLEPPESIRDSAQPPESAP